MSVWAPEEIKIVHQALHDALHDSSEVISPWQPIETAPTDETWVLVARRHEQAVAFCRSGVWHMGAGAYFARPTHWMPLPPPPTPIEEKKP